MRYRILATNEIIPSSALGSYFPHVSFAGQPDADILTLLGLQALADAPISPPPIADISPRQIRQALTRAGLRASVEAAVSVGDQDTKDWWEFATYFERNNPQVLAMGTALNVTDQQLDDLWALGASL